MKYSIITFMALLWVMPLAVFSGDYGELAGEPDNPATKLVYGVTEVALCWTEIPQSIYHYSEKYDPLSGLFLGLAEGTFLGVKDCAEGTVDATFFLFPPYKTKSKSFFHKLREWDKKVQDSLW